MGKLFAQWLYKQLETMDRKPNKLLYHTVVREDLQTLDPVSNIAQKQQDYVVKKLALCSTIVVIGILLSVVLWIREEMTIGIANNRLSRNNYGEGDKSVELVAKGETACYDFTLDIGEKIYTQAQLQELSQEAKQLLMNGILGDNQSLEKVEYDLHLVKTIDGYPFEISWNVDEQYIDYNGKLVKDILLVPQTTQITARLSYESFQEDYTITVVVYTKALQPDIAQKLAKQISTIECENRATDFVILPSIIGEQTLTWYYKRSYYGLLCLGLTPVIAILVFCCKDRDLHKQVLYREQQMLLDYPEIVSTLALLIGAGMTVPNAWGKIVADYKYRKEETGKKQYAYEEMLLTVYEMESGVAQTQAYEQFGRRCRIPKYNKLSTVLSQNIRKGASNLPILLKEEAKNAFEERKHTARQLGEKAGTKLLVPMMLLLGMILVVIMIPAFAIYL